MGYLATVLRRHETTQRIKQCVEKFSGTVTFDTDISDLDSAEAEKEDLGTPFERSIFGKGLTRRIIGINLYHGIPSPADMALFGEAKGLRFLNLCGINVDDETFASLHGLLHLEILNLNGTEVSNKGAVHFKCFPRLRALCLSQTKISDSALQVLGSLDHLEMVVLDHTEVTGAEMPVAPRLPRLRKFNVSGTQWCDVGVERLASLKSLEEIDVSWTMITDEGLRMLATLPKLRSLSSSFALFSVVCTLSWPPA
jgi:hypothetical protein